MAVPTVLLVTPFADERTIYSGCLRAQGFDVRIAEGPDDAFPAAADSPPDVVIARLRPGQAIAAVDAFHHLHPPHRGGPMPVVIITSSIQPELRVEALAAGYAGYLLLPALPDALIAEVRRVLSGPIQASA
jgi:two-component system cell cycle response regulator DivK